MVEIGVLFCEGRGETDRVRVRTGGEGEEENTGGRKLGESTHSFGKKLGYRLEKQWERDRI